MLQLTMTHGGRSYNERAIGHCISNGCMLFRVNHQLRRANCGTRLSKCDFIRIHHAQSVKTKVAHGPGNGTNIERVPWSDKHHNQTVCCTWGGQEKYSTPQRL